MMCECHHVFLSVCERLSSTDCQGSAAMPGKATASNCLFPRAYRQPASYAAEGATMPGHGVTLSPADHDFLLRLQRQALQYFLDNQVPGGLVLDRQSNHGPRRPHGLCSTTATGMGLIALALASAPPYQMLSCQTAVQRIHQALQAVLERLPHDQSVIPHCT